MLHCQRAMLPVLFSPSPTCQQKLSITLTHTAAAIYHFTGILLSHTQSSNHMG